MESRGRCFSTTLIATGGTMSFKGPQGGWNRPRAPRGREDAQVLPVPNSPHHPRQRSVAKRGHPCPPGFC